MPPPRGAGRKGTCPYLNLPVFAESDSHNLDAPCLARQRCRGKLSSANTYGAGAPFRFGGGRRLRKEQIVATHARKHTKILPSFGPHGCVKPYCYLVCIGLESSGA